MPKQKLGSESSSPFETGNIATGYFVAGIGIAVGVAVVPMLIGGLLEALGEHAGVSEALAISTGIVVIVLMGNWIIEQLFPIRQKEPDAFEGMTGWPVYRTPGRDQDHHRFRPDCRFRVP